MRVEAEPLELEERVFPLQQARVLYGGGPLYSAPFERTRVYEVSVPHWVPALVTAGLPAAWISSRLKQRRATARSAGGLCAACGYDLRGTDHERCPECGSVKGGATEAAA